MIPTEWYWCRVSALDVPTRQELDERIQSLPEFDSALLCSEFGKERFRHHWHVLIKFKQPMDISLAQWRVLLGRNGNYKARNPNAVQPLTLYVKNIAEYIQKDGDWWEYSYEELTV